MATIMLNNDDALEDSRNNIIPIVGDRIITGTHQSGRLAELGRNA